MLFESSQREEEEKRKEQKAMEIAQDLILRRKLRTEKALEAQCMREQRLILSGMRKAAEKKPKKAKPFLSMANVVQFAGNAGLLAYIVLANIDH